LRLCFCGGGGVFEVFLCFCDGVFVCFFWSSRPFVFSRRLHRCLAFGLSNLTPMLSRQLGPFVVDRRATARATEMLSHSTQPNRKFERALQKLTQTASLIKIGYKEN